MEASDARSLMQYKFNNLLNAKETKANGALLTNDKYLELIQDVKEAKGRKKRVPRDYWLLQHYDVLEIGDADKLIKPMKVLDSSEVVFYVKKDDLFDVLYDVHLETGHRGRDSMVKVIRRKYKNVTQEQIQIFLETCEVCYRKKNNEKKRVATRMRHQFQFDFPEMDNVPELTTMKNSEEVGEMEMKYDVADFVNIGQTFTSGDPLAVNVQEDDHHEISRNQILVNAIPRIVQQQKNTSSTSTITNMGRETVRKRILATISSKPKKMKNDTLNSTSKDADALDLFFEGIKSTMRQFSATDIHLVKTKIFSIVSEIEAKYLDVPETQTADDFEVVKVKVEPSDYNLEFCEEEEDEKNVNILEERMIKEEVNSWHDDDPLYLGETLDSANARDDKVEETAEVAFRPVSECCKNNCHSIFNAERQMQMNSEFYGLISSEEKDARVCAQVDVIGDDYRKERTRVYRLPDFSGFDVTVCKRMFCTVFNLTNDRLTYALSKKTFGAGKRS